MIRRPWIVLQENLLTPFFPLRFAVQLFLTGFVIASGTLAACHLDRQSAELAQTMAFTTLVVLEIVRVQMVQSQYTGISNPFIILALASSLLLQLLVVYTPFLQTVFGTMPYICRMGSDFNSGH